MNTIHKPYRQSVIISKHKPVIISISLHALRIIMLNQQAQAQFATTKKSQSIVSAHSQRPNGGYLFINRHLSSGYARHGKRFA